MQSSQWLNYFETNAQRPSPETPAVIPPLPPALHVPLVQALQCFQLGEAGEGRVARQAAQSNDRALDDNLKTCVALYVREEGRHAAELARLLRAMGETTITKHLSEKLFERSRRFMGLRTKMAVMTVAEVVGSTFYRTLAARVPCPHIADVMRVIAADEDRHLAFQRDYFTRVLTVTPVLLRPFLALSLWVWFLSVLTGAIVSVAFGQRKLLRALGTSPMRFAGQCLARLREVVQEVRLVEAEPSPLALGKSI